MLLYGRNPVLEALRAGLVEELLVARGVEESFIQELKAFDVRLKSPRASNSISWPGPPTTRA